MEQNEAILMVKVQPNVGDPQTRVFMFSHGISSRTSTRYNMSVLLVMLMVCGGWTSARPAKLPSTTLNLPIPDAIAKGANGHVLDSEKDYTHVEHTFKDMTIKNVIHKAFINIAHPTPIVDNIREEDKYGNAGDQLDGINKAIVKGTEVGTQFIGKIVSVPGKILSAGSGKITTALNGFGAYLIGL